MKRILLSYVIQLLLAVPVMAQDTVTCGDEGFICPYDGTLLISVFPDNRPPFTRNKTIYCNSFYEQPQGTTIYGIAFCSVLRFFLRLLLCAAFLFLLRYGFVRDNFLFRL